MRKLVSAIVLASAVGRGTVAIGLPTEPIAPKPDQMSCDELWYTRNSIYARNGYCFNTPHGSVRLRTWVLPALW